MGRIWIGTDTHLASKLFEASVAADHISCLVGYSIQEAEPVVGDRRLDFLLKRGTKLCFVEVKSATVSVDRVAQYPDSKSPRAKAHLVALAGKARDGDRAILLFSIQRGDVTAMRVNRGFDRQFDLVFDEARKAGVEVLAVKHRVAPLGFGPPIEIPVLC